MRSLGDLPPELVLAVARHLSLGSVNALARANRYLCHVLDGYLYSLDALRNHSMALFRAADEGCAFMVRKCLRHMPNFRDRAKRVRKPFLLAVTAGYKEVVDAFLEQSWMDANVTEDYTGQSALAIAVQNRFLGVVQLLVWRRPEIHINQQNKEGVTPLGVAIRSGQVEMVEFLITLRNIEVSSRDEDHYTALAWAVMMSDEHILRLLLTVPGIDVNAPIDSSDERCDTPLIHAAFRGDDKIVKVLLGHPGIDVEAKNSNGDTALTLARRYGYEKIVRRLRAAGATTERKSKRFSYPWLDFVTNPV
jgi:ankyrin repeat protein